MSSDLPHPDDGASSYIATPSAYYRVNPGDSLDAIAGGFG
ncbi:hypothetical protein BLA6863_05657 [Burkholderia lata]|uniref:LysM domain-containing protein n=1 Tax=Burkholderia lata (strain ATCC 17760 / DSM 23089 / LMG 22485 / NCIMB 9086 / R18194 / 383) TaxID=482957 RepID=A0A6P2QG02_BURL3|nr:hypothetical protein BLA6863_05657 [Burkholderia lata]